MTEVGVASPSAHGHAITSTAHPNWKARVSGCVPRSCITAAGSWPRATATDQHTYVRIARLTTHGTKTDATRSAYDCTYIFGE